MPDVTPSERMLPHWNSMAMFTVQPGRSFHSVQEVSMHVLLSQLKAVDSKVNSTGRPVGTWLERTCKWHMYPHRWSRVVVCSEDRPQDVLKPPYHVVVS